MAVRNPQPQLVGADAMSTFFSANAPSLTEVQRRPNARPGRFGTSRAIGFRSGPGGEDVMAPGSPAGGGAAPSGAAVTGPALAPGVEAGQSGAGEPSGYTMGDFSNAGTPGREVLDPDSRAGTNTSGSYYDPAPDPDSLAGTNTSGSYYDAAPAAPAPDAGAGTDTSGGYFDPGPASDAGAGTDTSGSYYDSAVVGGAGGDTLSEAAPGGGYEPAAGGAGVDVGGAPADAGYEAAPGGAGVDAGSYGGGGGYEAGGAEGGGGGESGGCFLTEAVASAGGMGDNAPELQTLRSFRDNVMLTNPVGQALVQQYEAIAPLVVEGVSARPDAMQIFQQIKAEYIDPACNAIVGGHTEEALQIYAAMIAFVTPLAIEAVTGPGGESADQPYGDDQGAMDDLGTDAAMMAHSPEMRTMATGDQQYSEGDQLMGGGGPVAQPPADPAMGAMGQPNTMGAPTGAAAMSTMFAPAAANPPPQQRFQPRGY